MFDTESRYRAILFSMSKKYVIAIGVVSMLILTAFFVIRSKRMETLSAQSGTDHSQEIRSEDMRQEMPPTDAEADRPEEATDDKIEPKTDTVAEEKTIKRDVPVKEVAKENVAKIAEEPKMSTELPGVQSRLVSFGFSVPSQSRTIDTIILHSSYNSLGADPYSVDDIIDIYKSYGVAAHYLIARNGTVYQLVKDENVAYHAGVSQVPDGRKNVNDFSIGIEIVNTLDGKYTDDQYASVKKLIASLKGKYAIKYVLGHDDIAPGRKTDPWNFDWKKL